MSEIELRGFKMKSVVIYSLPGCPHCIAAKKFFKEKGVEYNDLNVEDEKNAEKAVQVSGQYEVPIILIDDKMIIGFNKNKIEGVAKIKKW